MNPSLSIPAGGGTSAARRNSFIILLIIALITGTFLRISLVVLYPFIVLFIALFFRFKITASCIILIILAGSSFLFSLFDNSFLTYKLLSLFYMLPLLLLLFSNPPPSRDVSVKHLPIFFVCLSIVAVLNDVVGIVQFIKTPESDDSFTGIYSQYSVSLNGLMIFNVVLFYYYFIKYITSKKLNHFVPMIFFLSCAVLGFYGAGLIVSIAAFILSFFRFQLKAVFRTFAIGILSLAVIYLLMLYIKPTALEYNIANLKKIAAFDVASGPRKVASFYNYTTAYTSNIKDFLFGSGPGTFNSRSAFMVGSPSYAEFFRPIKDPEQPYYFKNYAYSLWNDSNTSKELYLDGFRNQPFSSILAFLGEYGFIFTLAFFLLYFRYYKTVASIYRTVKSNASARVYFRLFKFLIILLPLLLLIDNYFEYPEMMLLIILSIKLAHSSLHQLQTRLFNEY